ncbi:MAG TPA: SDR family oxidoreductase [Acidimicrobiales bacterium]|nr:SDR family oxidoreductase [Acidimicrobiales bacterium]
MNKRVAVVTGGSSGIGLACARMLAEAEYDVVITARREQPLRDAAQAIGARYVAGDSADEKSFANVVAACDRVDLLVHAAGVLDGTFVRKESVATFDAVIRTNLRSAFVITSAVLPVMPEGGRIVFLSSSSAHTPQPGRSAYSASKAGLNAFAGALAQEVDRDGISVHVVTTGPVATPMLADVHFPMLTLEADDVARVVAWLDQQPPNVALLEVAIDSVQQGPFAPVKFVPDAAKRLGRT